jgi:hypothetical protein
MQGNYRVVKGLHLVVYALNLSNDGCRWFPLVFIRGIAIIRGAGFIQSSANTIRQVLLWRKPEFSPRQFCDAWLSQRRAIDCVELA